MNFYISRPSRAMTFTCKWYVVCIPVLWSRKHQPSSFWFTRSRSWITLQLCNINLLNVTSSLISRNLREWMFLSLNLTLCYHVSLPYIMDFDIQINHQNIQIMHSHSSCCHHCNVDIVLFHVVTCYTDSLLSHIRVNIVDLLNITCILVDTCIILGRFRVDST